MDLRCPPTVDDVQRDVVVRRHVGNVFAMNSVIVRLFTQKKIEANDAPPSAVTPPPAQVATRPAPRHSGQVGRWRLGKLRSEHDGVAVFDAWADEAHGPRAPYVVKLVRRSAPPAVREALAREATAARD